MNLFHHIKHKICHRFSEHRIYQLVFRLTSSGLLIYSTSKQKNGTKKGINQQINMSNHQVFQFVYYKQSSMEIIISCRSFPSTWFIIVFLFYSIHILCDWLECAWVHVNMWRYHYTTVAVCIYIQYTNSWNGAILFALIRYARVVLILFVIVSASAYISFP